MTQFQPYSQRATSSVSPCSALSVLFLSLVRFFKALTRNCRPDDNLQGQIMGKEIANYCLSRHRLRERGRVMDERPNDKKYPLLLRQTFPVTIDLWIIRSIEHQVTIQGM